MDDKLKKEILGIIEKESLEQLLDDYIDVSGWIFIQPEKLEEEIKKAIEGIK